jgi:hypothetical protein
MGDPYKLKEMKPNEKVTAISLRERLLIIALYTIGVLIMCALATQVYFMYSEIFNTHEENLQLVNNLDHKIDGTFKNDPNNIWYNADEHIYVEKVTNKVVIGKLAGNRNLEFGVKNVLEEFLQEKGYDLTPTAENKVRVEIVYLDMLTIKKNVSVFHKDENEVVIRLRGILYKDGIKEKEVMVEESSSEISMSTLIVDEGGKFNQTSLSNALKKGCDKLITKLLEK